MTKTPSATKNRQDEVPVEDLLKRLVLTGADIVRIGEDAELLVPACAGAGCCPPGGSAPRRLFFLPLYLPCFPSVSLPSIAGFSIFLNGKPALWLCIYPGKRMVFFSCVRYNR